MFTNMLLLSLLFVTSFESASLIPAKINFVVDFCVDHVRTKYAVVFSCWNHKSDWVISNKIHNFIKRSIFVRFVDLNRTTIDLREILTRFLSTLTCVVVELNCSGAEWLLMEASKYKYFNKSYQWLLLDLENRGLGHFANGTKKIGLNAQVTYANTTSRGDIDFYDLHSKGQHLKSPLIAIQYGSWKFDEGLSSTQSVEYLQGIKSRKYFNGLTLRGVAVIDRDNITSTQVDNILSDPGKTAGVSPFSKYHYSLANILQEYFNFTINYRITHGWAGRLLGSDFRLGFLGVLQRDEADIGGSGAFNRINRFAEFDTIHSSWKFDAAFLYRITAELKDSGSGGGSFLLPFGKIVWIVSSIALLVLCSFWKLFAMAERKTGMDWRFHYKEYSVLVSIVGLVCQQGLVQTPYRLSTRIIAFALLVFSLLMHNFYTSSVVGGLLSTRAKGPQNITELMDTSLILSFEDIGYHKVIFKETDSSLLKKMYHTRVQPSRSLSYLPAYTTIQEAVQYLKTGRYAFHCERIDAYPEIARLFEPNEICDLRSVSGLFDVQIMNMIVTKHSAYTEMFRIALHRARELGLIRRELRVHRPEKPRCQSGSTVHPVTLNGVMNAFELLMLGWALSMALLVLEVLAKHFLKYRKTKIMTTVEESQ